MNIPTRITVARIALVVALLIGLFVCTCIPNLDVSAFEMDGVNLIYLIAMLVFVVAASTDFIDGYLARKWHQVTNLGKFLDPVADKMLVNSMLIFLIFPWDFLGEGQLLMPAFAVIIMVVRDLVVDAIRFIAAQRGGRRGREHLRKAEDRVPDDRHPAGAAQRLALQLLRFLLAFLLPDSDDIRLHRDFLLSAFGDNLCLSE